MSTNNREPAYDGGPFNFIAVGIFALAGIVAGWFDTLTGRSTK